MPELPLVSRARGFGSRRAIVSSGGTFSYTDLLDASARVAEVLLDSANDLHEARVAFIAEPGFDYVAAQWGIWRAGGIAVPLAVSHPAAELEYVIGDADAAVVMADPEMEGRVRGIAERSGRRFISLGDVLPRLTGDLPRHSRVPSRHSRESGNPETSANSTLGPRLRGDDGVGERAESALGPRLRGDDGKSWDDGRRAMMIYTSGTTGRPKGVVTTHANLRAQVESLVDAWEWSADDRTLLVLPLHHVHGIVNVLTCALWSGATCEILPRFDADAVWSVIEDGRLTVFMAVPTIYSRLIAAWEAAPPERRERMSAGCRRMRLMVSGSAALPVSTLERWREISGHTLLERYGMTEIGMALSNSLHGERRPGHVGVPLPRVEVRLVNEDGSLVEPGTPGEIEVRGPTVFREYWRRPDATAEAFRDGGWFRTGDVALVEDGYYRILGRRSVDIIKTGGYKVSALEIEEVLRTHPGIAECAVVGVPDDEWGERICVAAEATEGGAPELAELQDWARERLAPYKLPREMYVVEALPRNAMGKVVKGEVGKLFAKRTESTPSG